MKFFICWPIIDDIMRQRVDRQFGQPVPDAVESMQMDPRPQGGGDNPLRGTGYEWFKKKN